MGGRDKRGHDGDLESGENACSFFRGLFGHIESPHPERFSILHSARSPSVDREALFCSSQRVGIR